MKRLTSFFAMALFSANAFAATTLAFEKFSPGMDHHLVPSGYGGLEWQNFEVLNAQNQGFRTGYRAGVISPNNVIFNAFGDPASIYASQSFALNSAHMTAAVIDGLEVRVVGFAADTQLYEKTVNLSSTAPTLVRFDFEGVDRVQFVSTPSSQFAMDELNVNVPGAGPSGDPVITPWEPAPPINLGRVEVSKIGNFTLQPPPLPFASISPRPAFYLIDQNQRSGGGARLPNVDVNWDTNSAFEITLAAPDGKKFAVKVPAGANALFNGFLWWEAGDRGGTSPSDHIIVEFADLVGAAPSFVESDSVLSASHGFFGVADLESTLITNDFSFIAMTIRGTVSPQMTGLGTRTFIPHNECSLLISGEGISVEIVDAGQAGELSIQPARIYSIAPRPNGTVVLDFSGILQSSASVEGPYEDVARNPRVLPTVAGTAQFFRVRD